MLVQPWEHIKCKMMGNGSQSNSQKVAQARQTQGQGQGQGQGQEHDGQEHGHGHGHGQQRQGGDFPYWAAVQEGRIEEVAAGACHSLLLLTASSKGVTAKGVTAKDVTAKGKVIGAGSNRYGQLGEGGKHRPECGESNGPHTLQSQTNTNTKIRTMVTSTILSDDQCVYK